jgi:hypothetical protein
VPTDKSSPVSNCTYVMYKTPVLLSPVLLENLSLYKKWI